MAIFTANTRRVTVEEALAVTIEQGVRAAKASLTPTFNTVGGIVRNKTQSTLRDQRIELAVYAHILDMAFKWYGEWGQTPHAIELELVRRAKEPR